MISQKPGIKDWKFVEDLKRPVHQKIAWDRTLKKRGKFLSKTA